MLIEGLGSAESDPLPPAPKTGDMFYIEFHDIKEQQDYEHNQGSI